MALASLASAVQWTGAAYTSAPGAWETASNWGGTLPAASDTNAGLYRSDGLGGNITVSTAVAGSIKPQMKFGNTKLTIYTGGSMSADGSFEFGTSGSTGNATVTIKAGGLLDVCKKVTQTTGTWKIASAAPTSTTATVNIYGTAKVKGTLATSDVVIGYTGGNAVVNIYNGGLLNVDAYTISATGKGIVKIWGGGTMQIKGNKTTQTSADITAGRIAGQGLGTVLQNYYDSGTDSTFVTPEPATVALLGLGSLLLYRKKH